MEELRNLKQLASLAAGRMNQYDGKDFELPEAFKENVVEINSNTVKYNRYSAVIETRGNQHGILNIFMPNQWFYIASYFTDLYTELMTYKKYALEVAPKERLKIIGQSAHTLNQEEEAKLNNLDISEQSKKYLSLFITDYSWWGGAKTIDRGDFYVSPILNYARLVNASQSFVADLCAFLADKKDLVHLIINQEEQTRQQKSAFNYQGGSLQVIYYGAPGTGKSHAINTLTSTKAVIRTTFHPDSDYSTFVGSYKPTMEEMPVFGAQGVEVAKEKRITYAFVKQAFLKAYLGAWQKYSKGGETVEPQFLVIEEINRGNCAQIFGDLFQLLDRSDNGFSTYPIEADSDLQNEISKAFADGGEYAIESELDVDGAVKGYTSNYGKTLSDDIKSGRVLLLPNNLYIWATMNTSDQSLFPIDSAFKRRWDWQYVKIADAGKGWKIKCGDEYCDWWTFIEEINKKIAKETSSDDKKLGYFFCKPSKDGDTITEEKFVGKVLFYLWNDVFKDGDITLFKVNDEPEAEICFDAFYSNNNKVNVEAIRKFLVGVVGEENIMSKDDVEDQALEASLEGGKVDRSQYTFNGTGKYGKSKLGQTIVDKYLSQHKDLTFDQIKQMFPDSMLNDIPGRGLIVKEGVDLKGYQRYYKSGYTSSDGINYLIYKQWTLKNIQSIIEFAKKQNWSVEKL